MNRSTRFTAPIFTAILLSLSLGAHADDWKVSVNDLIDETQRVSDHPDRLGLVWWLPDEFWQVRR